MLLLRVLAGIASLVVVAEATDTDQPMDLGSVLSRHPKLSTYYKLIQVQPSLLNSEEHNNNDPFTEIPRYSIATAQLRWHHCKSSYSS